MRILIQVLIIFVCSTLNIFPNPIVDYEVKQVADFQISEGGKSFEGITFKDSLNGVALIRNQDYEFYIFRTSNAGDSWDFISEIDIYDRWVMKGIAPPDIAGISCFEDFICITTRPYLSLFGPQPPADTGVYMISYDFGETWEINNFPEKLSISPPKFDSSGDLFVSVSNWDFRKQTSTRKGIFKYIKTNNSWHEISLPELRDSATFSYLKLLSNNKYQFVLNKIKIDDNDKKYIHSYIYQTDDNGNNWNFIEIPFLNADVQITSENVIWVRKVEQFIINDDSIGYRILLYKTIDKGVNWENQIDTIINLSKVTSPIKAENFVAYDDDNVWLFYSGARQFITNNGGKDWVTFPKLDDVYMPTHGFYLNKNTIFMSNLFQSHLLYKFTFDIATSVIERTVELKFKIYPNPVTYGSDFIAEYEIATSGHLKMYLSDLSGREVCPLYSDFAESGSYSISLRLPENISSGSYWLVSEQHGYKHVQLLNVVK